MVWEALAALAVGLAALWLVLQPLLAPGRPRAEVVEPPDPEETPKGVALTALKEIEFDRETGKLSDADYELLKSKYTAAALEALRASASEGGGPGGDDIEAMITAKVRSLRSTPASSPSPVPACPTCGPRPEADAVFCSICGRRLPVAAVCVRCRAPLAPGSRYCEACGTAFWLAVSYFGSRSSQRPGPASKTGAPTGSSAVRAPTATLKFWLRLGRSRHRAHSVGPCPACDASTYPRLV